jgi:hypothetical protein
MHHLDSELDENLVHVIMIEADQSEHEIYFSRVAGEQNTYQMSENFMQYLES